MSSDLAAGSGAAGDDVPVVASDLTAEEISDAAATKVVPADEMEVAAHQEVEISSGSALPEATPAAFVGRDAETGYVLSEEDVSMKESIEEEKVLPEVSGICLGGRIGGNLCSNSMSIDCDTVEKSRVDTVQRPCSDLGENKSDCSDGTQLKSVREAQISKTDEVLASHEAVCCLPKLHQCNDAAEVVEEVENTSLGIQGQSAIVDLKVEACTPVKCDVTTVPPNFLATVIQSSNDEKKSLNQNDAEVTVCVDVVSDPMIEESNSKPLEASEGQITGLKPEEHEVMVNRNEEEATQLKDIVGCDSFDHLSARSSSELHLKVLEDRRTEISLDQNLKLNSADVTSKSESNQGDLLTDVGESDVVEISNHAIYDLPLLRKEGYNYGDLVWGELHSHPWPGQIVKPSYASDMAPRCEKNDSHLIAYFGDKSFAWCDESQLMHLAAGFATIGKQATSDAFTNAVNSVLLEVSRRMEVGSCCSCVPQEFHPGNISTKFENAGIANGFDCSVVDRSEILGLFHPDKLIDYVKSVAVSPHSGTDRLHLAIARSQIKSFCCSKLSELQSDRNCADNSLEVAICAVTPEIDKRMKGVVGQHKSKNALQENEAVNVSAELNEGNTSSGVTNGAEIVLYSANDAGPVSSSGRTEVDFDFYDPEHRTKRRFDTLEDGRPPSLTGSFKIGECIRRVANRMTGSSFVSRVPQETSRKINVGNEDGRFNVFVDDSADETMADKSLSDNEVFYVEDNPDASIMEKQAESSDDESFDEPVVEKREKRRYVRRYRTTDPEEVLALLCYSATDPLNGFLFVSSTIRFFTDFRNFVVSHDTNTIVIEKVVKKRGRKRKVDIMSTLGEDMTDHMQEAYWSGNGKRLRGGNTWPRRMRKRPREMDFVPQTENLRTTVQNLHFGLTFKRQATESSIIHVEDKILDEHRPTALILTFRRSNALPSETDLVRIFSRYGPLKEKETVIRSTENCAKVVFKKRVDADAAFSGAGKYGTFGPSVKLISYRLMDFPLSSETSWLPEVKRPPKECHNLVGDTIITDEVLGNKDSKSPDDDINKDVPHEDVKAKECSVEVTAKENMKICGEHSHETERIADSIDFDSHGKITGVRISNSNIASETSEKSLEQRALGAVPEHGSKTDVLVEGFTSCIPGELIEAVDKARTLELSTISVETIEFMDLEYNNCATSCKHPIVEIDGKNSETNLLDPDGKEATLKITEEKEVLRSADEPVSNSLLETHAEHGNTEILLTVGTCDCPVNEHDEAHVDSFYSGIPLNSDEIPVDASNRNIHEEDKSLPTAATTGAGPVLEEAPHTEPMTEVGSDLQKPIRAESVMLVEDLAEASSYGAGIVAARDESIVLNSCAVNALSDAALAVTVMEEPMAEAGDGPGEPIWAESVMEDAHVEDLTEASTAGAGKVAARDECIATTSLNGNALSDSTLTDSAIKMPHLGAIVSKDTYAGSISDTQQATAATEVAQCKVVLEAAKCADVVEASRFEVEAEESPCDSCTFEKMEIVSDGLLAGATDYVLPHEDACVEQKNVPISGETVEHVESIDGAVPTEPGTVQTESEANQSESVSKDAKAEVKGNEGEVLDEGIPYVETDCCCEMISYDEQAEDLGVVVEVQAADEIMSTETIAEAIHGEVLKAETDAQFTVEVTPVEEAKVAQPEADEFEVSAAAKREEFTQSAMLAATIIQDVQSEGVNESANAIDLESAPPQEDESSAETARDAIATEAAQSSKQESGI